VTFWIVASPEFQFDISMKCNPSASYLRFASAVVI